MPAPSPFAPFIDPLERLGLPYCELEGGGAWIAPPEYVVLRKLEYLREGGQDKHVRDIRFVLAATEVDRSFIEAEVMRLGLRAQWSRCQADG